MIINTFRKRPVEVEAVRIERELHLGKLFEWWNKRQNELYGVQERRSPFVKEMTANGVVVYITTLAGEMKAYEGEYIMMGVEGELYPIKTSVLRRTYDHVGEREDGQA